MSCKGALPSVNLRGTEGDERESKCRSSYLTRADSVDHVDPSPVSSAGVHDAFVAAPCPSAVDTLPSKSNIIAIIAQGFPTGSRWTPRGPQRDVRGST